MVSPVNERRLSELLVSGVLGVVEALPEAADEVLFLLLLLSSDLSPDDQQKYNDQ